MNASHNPLVSPVPKKGTRVPKAIAIPVTMRSHPNVCPRNETRRVDPWRSRLRPQRMDRRTRPPSSGNAGIRLKSPIPGVGGAEPHEERGKRTETGQADPGRLRVAHRDGGAHRGGDEESEPEKEARGRSH